MFVGAQDEIDNASREFERGSKLGGDHRIAGPIAKFLRRSSLDELPQLWCVLRGDMSLVGPRPVTSREVDVRYRGHAETVLSVRPGLTGLWQVSGRSRLPYEDRVALDVLYVRSRSLRTDIGIILRTPLAVLTADGAG